ncbi:hypothetical protein [Dactylosporangium sp. NPDC049140]|uniref:hypothetical protein n=1 Tax=Dactylosporangium sp. NPDC049140 TaxID=3155647 RepID=UPI0034027263
MGFDLVVEALAGMALEPRGPRWASISYCVVDAVWSISARYDQVVLPLVGRVAARNGDPRPLVGAGEPLPADPLPLAAFRARYPDAMALRSDTNGERTSTTGGISKADAALRYAGILDAHDVPDLHAVAGLRADRERWEAVNLALAAVPGEGRLGIRRGCLWMHCGDDTAGEPDRLILRWLARHGVPATPDEGRAVLERAAGTLTGRLGRPVTPWMVGRAIRTRERAH